MPHDTPPPSVIRLSKISSLLTRYTLILAAYLILMAVLWRIGVEAIYQHPTPFYALYLPVFTHADFWPVTLTYQALAVALFAAFAYLAHWATRRVQWAELATTRALTRREQAWFLVALVGYAVLFAGAIAMIRGGTHGIAQAYERPSLEYIHDIGTGGSITGLFRDYAKVHDYLTAHSRVHPPGPIAILWLLSYGVGRSALALGLASMALGGLAIIPLYFWVRDMCNPRIALTAAMLYATIPSIVLFTATSADITFTPVTITTLFLFWRALDRRSIPYALAAGFGYALMSLISFTLLGIGAFFALEGLRRIGVFRQWRAVIQTAVLMLATFLSAHVALRLATGFDYIGALNLAMAAFDHDQAMLQELAPRYGAWAWKILNPAALFFFAGIPVSMLFLYRLRYPQPDTKSLFIVFGLSLLALDILYMARGEGERSAMYVLPFVVIPAAHLLDQLGTVAQSRRLLFATLTFMALQCWLIEVTFYTYW